jgi:hypothetical protein
VYSHVKNGENCYARLVYGIEINKFFIDEVDRPYRIHYHFELFQNGQAVKVIEGMFENTSPKLTKDDYYPGTYGYSNPNSTPSPYPHRENFKFEPYICCSPPTQSDNEEIEEDCQINF